MKKRKRRARRELLLTAILGVALLLAGGLAQLLGGGTAGAATPPVRFCRVMTLNRGACYPVGGQYYDWLELENPGAADVSLRGWRLADGLDLRGAYVFGDVAVPAGGRLLVHCARRPGDAPADALFTGFALSSDGEFLVLADPAERIADTLSVPALKANRAYRRDESGAWTEEAVEPRPDGTALGVGALQISEVMPANHGTLADADGDFSDWIELHNAGAAPVDLEGYSLSDAENKARWAFPAVTLSPGEYRVVFASGKNRRDPNGELHTSFKLSAADLAVHLKDPRGTEVARLACDIDAADVSVCLDDAGNVTKQWPPTPGYRNSATGIPDEMPAVSQNPYGLYINEVMDASGGADWAELVNTGAADIDLAGMGLSDDPARPRKWQFPSGARIPAGGCLLVALSGGDETIRAPYTVDFGLRVGESLCLCLADGTVIDRVRLYARPVGVSYGRAAGEARYRYFPQPTPGAPNAGQSYGKQTQAVTFSERGGLRDEASVTVALSSDPGAMIRYTLDGSEPTASSALYQQPLTLYESCTVRAAAQQQDALPSAPSAATYILGERHPGMYTVCVSGDYDALIGPNGALNTGLKRDNCDVFVEIYDADGERLIGQTCDFMISGHSSRLKDNQKAFRLKARASYGDSRFRAKLFSNRDYTAFKSITLRASGQDNHETHIRDSVLSTLAADTSVMYLESEVAVVYVNGQYWGLYNMRERVSPTGIAIHEGWDDPDDVLLVRNGEREQGSLSTYNSLMAWIAKADLSVPENLDSLRQYVDVENYLDYVALEMYTCNLDLSNMRCYCNPATGGKWKWIFFDLDLSFKVDRNMARDWLIPGGVGTITQQDNTLFIKLMENAGMRDAFLTRMGELLRGTFSADSVVARFEARRALIAPEIELNCARWKWSSDKWREACDRFVEYAKARPAKLVEYLTMAFQLTDAQAQAYFAGVR